MTPSSADFVGRERELAVLGESLSRAAGGAPVTVLIGGEAGAGKSRLVQEFTAGAQADLLSGGCVEVDAGGLPFAPFTAVLRGMVRDRGADAVIALLPGGVPGEIARLLPGLGSFDTGADADTVRARLFEGVLSLLANASAQRPVVLVVEDLHWADRSSRDLLSYVIRNQQAASALLIVATYRSDELDRAHPLRRLFAELDRLAWTQRLDLPHLRRPELSALARGVLGSEPPAGLVEEVYRRSQGNPLFAESLLRCYGQPGLPETLRDLLLARVDRLTDPAQPVLRVMSAAGGPVEHALLAAAAGLEDAALSDLLRPAVAAGVVVTDDGGYAFQHELIREAVYGDQLPADRIRAHVRFAKVLTERAGRGLQGTESREHELAYHWYAAGEAERALESAWRAACDAEARLAYAERLDMLERVLELWDRVQAAAESICGRRDAVLSEAVSAALRAGEHERGVRLTTDALARVRGRGGDPACAAVLLDQRARMLCDLGLEGELDDLYEAVRVAPAEHPARAGALCSLASRLMVIPRTEEALAAAEEALAVAERVGDARSQALALLRVAELRARRGGVAGQLPQFERARVLAEREGAHGVLLEAIYRHSDLLEAFGDYEQAEATARHGIAVASAVGLTRTEGCYQSVCLVMTLISRGRWDLAVEEVHRALDLSPPPATEAHLRCLRAWVALARGETGPAEAALDFAREVFRSRPRFAIVALLVRLEAELRFAQGQPAEAALIIERALPEFDLEHSSRFAWPLLVTGARVAASGQPGLLARLRRDAESTFVLGEPQQAYQLTFAAEAARAARTPDRAAWQAAVTAWDGLDDPYSLAQVLVGAARAAAADGDRDAAAVLARRAARLADSLGARPLREQIDTLARRARITVADGSATDASGPAPAARREYGLTARELEVLRLVALGRSNADIGAELFISAKTASVHVSNIIAKLGVSGRTEAAALAHRSGLVDP